MKRIICVLLTVVLLCSFVSCVGEKEPEVKEPTAAEKVDEMIAAIPQNDSVRLHKGEIILAEMEYNSLSAEEKKQVKNYDQLKKLCRDLKFENTYDGVLSSAQSAAKYSLKNPSTFQYQNAYIYICYDESRVTPICARARIYFSGQNSFGGTVDEKYYYYCKINEDGTRTKITEEEYNEMKTSQNGVECYLSSDLDK